MTNTRKANQTKRSFPKTGWFLVCISLLSTNIGYAEVSTASGNSGQPFVKQNLSAIKIKVADYLKQQTIGYPGSVSINVGAIDPNLKFAACDELQLALPSGSRAWGKTSVIVQCHTPSKWSIYVQSTVKVIGQYVVAAAPLAQGQLLSERDVIYQEGDLTQLPAGIFTEQTQAVGRSVQISMTAGTVIRQEMLRQVPVIQQGQTVKVVSLGEGFSVSAEGTALSKANDGQVVQVKVASGKVVTGVARQGGQIEVAF